MHLKRVHATFVLVPPLAILTLPLGMDVEEPFQTAIAWPHGAAAVLFRKKVFRAVTGQLIGGTGKRISISQLGKIAKKGLLGHGGIFYIEDIEPGEYEGRAGKCSFQIVVPDVPMPIQDVGVIQCNQ